MIRCFLRIFYRPVILRRRRSAVMSNILFDAVKWGG